jgi:hypothetical protein
MGYYKNMEIEQQVEVADRTPKPKPVTHHVAWPTVTYSPSVARKMVTHFPTRRLQRQIERATARRVMKRRCVWTLSILGGVALVALGIGVGVTL